MAFLSLTAAANTPQMRDFNTVLSALLTSERLIQDLDTLNKITLRYQDEFAGDIAGKDYLGGIGATKKLFYAMLREGQEASDIISKILGGGKFSYRAAFPIVNAQYNRYLDALEESGAITRWTNPIDPSKNKIDPRAPAWAKSNQQEELEAEQAERERLEEYQAEDLKDPGQGTARATVGLDLLNNFLVTRAAQPGGLSNPSVAMAEFLLRTPGNHMKAAQWALDNMLKGDLPGPTEYAHKSTFENPILKNQQHVEFAQNFLDQALPKTSSRVRRRIRPSEIMIEAMSKFAKDIEGSTLERVMAYPQTFLDDLQKNPNRFMKSILLTQKDKLKDMPKDEKSVSTMQQQVIRPEGEGLESLTPEEVSSWEHYHPDSPGKGSGPLTEDELTDPKTATMYTKMFDSALKTVIIPELVTQADRVLTPEYFKDIIQMPKTKNMMGFEEDVAGVLGGRPEELINAVKGALKFSGEPKSYLSKENLFYTYNNNLTKMLTDEIPEMFADAVEGMGFNPDVLSRAVEGAADKLIAAAIPAAHAKLEAYITQNKAEIEEKIVQAARQSLESMLELAITDAAGTYNHAARAQGTKELTQADAKAYAGRLIDSEPVERVVSDMEAQFPAVEVSETGEKLTFSVTGDRGQLTNTIENAILQKGPALQDARTYAKGIVDGTARYFGYTGLAIKERGRQVTNDEPAKAPVPETQAVPNEQKPEKEETQKPAGYVEENKEPEGSTNT